MSAAIWKAHKLLSSVIHHCSQDTLLLNLSQPSLDPQPRISTGWIFLHLEANNVYALLTDRVNSFIFPKKCIKDSVLNHIANFVGVDFIESHLEGCWDSTQILCKNGTKKKKKKPQAGLMSSRTSL